ncbi:sortilin-related receptor, partial [Caerostris extrusa]
LFLTTLSCIPEVVRNGKTSHPINFDFEPGVNYTFWMMTFNRKLESKKSDPFVIDFAKDSVLSPVTNLHSLSTNGNTITVKDLAPGAKYIFRIFPYNGQFKGPDEKIEVTTKGIPLPSVPF